MGFLKTQGIVIREVNTGEADRILTIFSRKAGKLTASARGSRRPKNTLAAGTQYLCYSDFVLFKGRDMYSVDSADVLEPFYELRNDVEKLTYSAHLVDLTAEVLQENQPSVKLLQLLLNCLHFLAKTDKSPELIARIFEFRFISLAGYAPWVSNCMNCGCEDVEKLLFSFKKCGFLCENCRQQDFYAQKMSAGAARAINHIVISKLSELFSFEVSREVLDELRLISRRYLRERLERDFTRLDYIEKIKKFQSPGV